MAITLKEAIKKDQKRSDGTYNVKIRITLNRKVGYISTEHYVTEKQMTEGLKEIKDTFIRGEMAIELKNLREEISKLGAKVNNYTVKQLGDYLQEKRNPTKSGEIDFIAFSEKVIEQMKNDNRDSYRNYQAAINNLMFFIQRDNLNIMEFTARFLRKYENHLNNKEGIGSRGIELNMSSLRRLFNLAREEYNDEDTGNIRIAHYPFNSYKIPKADQAEQRSLSIYNILSIMDYEYELSSKHAIMTESPRPELARDVYMLSFYLVGINSIDLYNLEKIDKKGRITYNRSKTKGRRADKAQISIKVPKEALPLVKKYADPTKKRLFNFYLRYSTSQGFNLAVNKGLKVVGKSVGIDKLDYYSARHSWATIARNDCDVSMDDIALSLNHTSDSRVTDMYVRKDWSRIDNANNKVLKFMHSAREKKEMIGNIITALSTLIANNKNSTH